METGPFDPLRACADAVVDFLVHDPYLVRSLPRLAVEAGFEVERLRGHSFVEAPSSGGLIAVSCVTSRRAGTNARETREDTMPRFTTRRFVIASAVVVAAAAIGGGVAVAAGGDDDATDTPITGAALQKASAAALASTRGGRVTGTEVGDEESRYEVEVTLDDGSQVDVQLDERFRVVGSEAERGESDD